MQALGEALDPDKLERLGRYETQLDRKFERTLSTLISRGVPILDGLEITARTAGNAIIEDAKRIGVDVGSETAYQYQPEQTTSAIICHHPAAKYFVVRR